jgi:hypothetical protein
VAQWKTDWKLNENQKDPGSLPIPEKQKKINKVCSRKKQKQKIQGSRRKKSLSRRQKLFSAEF